MVNKNMNFCRMSGIAVWCYLWSSNYLIYSSVETINTLWSSLQENGSTQLKCLALRNIPQISHPRSAAYYTLNIVFIVRLEKTLKFAYHQKYTTPLIRTWSVVSLHDIVQTDTTTDRTTYFPSLSSPDLLWSLGLDRQTQSGTIASIQYSINFPVFYLGELVQTGTAYIYIRSAVIWGKISWYDEKTLIKLLTLLKLIRICY